MTEKTVFIDGIEVTLETVGDENDVVVTETRDGTESFVESLAEDIADNADDGVSVEYVHKMEHKDGVYSVSFDVPHAEHDEVDWHGVFAGYSLNTFVFEGFIPICVHGTTVWVKDVDKHDYLSYDA